MPTAAKLVVVLLLLTCGCAGREEPRVPVKPERSTATESAAMGRRQADPPADLPTADPVAASAAADEPAGEEDPRAVDEPEPEPVPPSPVAKEGRSAADSAVKPLARYITGEKYVVWPELHFPLVFQIELPDVPEEIRGPFAELPEGPAEDRPDDEPAREPAIDPFAGEKAPPFAPGDSPVRR